MSARTSRTRSTKACTVAGETSTSRTLRRSAASLATPPSGCTRTTSPSIALAVSISPTTARHASASKNCGIPNSPTDSKNSIGGISRRPAEGIPSRAAVDQPGLARPDGAVAERVLGSPHEQAVTRETAEPETLDGLGDAGPTRIVEVVKRHGRARCQARPPRFEGRHRGLAVVHAVDEDQADIAQIVAAVLTEPLPELDARRDVRADEVQVLL